MHGDVPARADRPTGRHALVDDIPFHMPVDSRNSIGAIIAAFPVDRDKARALLPSRRRASVRLWNRGLLMVTVIDYVDTDIGAYIEFSLAIACTMAANRRRGCCRHC